MGALTIIDDGEVETAALQTADPTDAQREAGNYRKGHVMLHGMDVSIENPAGTKRRPEWPPLAHHYGYIRGTSGSDDEHIDVFLGPGAEDPDKPVFVLDQIRPSTGEFDEHKVMLGFDNEGHARAGYLANYAPGWGGIGGVKRMSVDEFKTWIKGGDTSGPVAMKSDACIDWDLVSTFPSVKATRFDKFRIDTTRRDQNGYLEAKASVTRAGVFVYRHPNGTVTRELRHPDEVFRPDSLASLRNRPITFGHPAVGKLNSKNTRQHSVGSAVGEVQRNNMLVDTTLQITDEDTITRMETEDSPYREVSAGYDAEIVRKDGVWNGEPYDHVQKNIVYNHIAIVPKGRAGHDVRVHLDAADATMERYDTDEDDKTVTVIRRDRGDFEQDSFAARAVPGAAGVQGTFAKFARDDDAEQEYVSRCMGEPEKLSEFPDEKQRAAVCYSKYHEKGDAVIEYAQQFTFAKSDGWTVDKATKWVQDYREPSPTDDNRNRSADMKLKLRKDAVNTRTFKADAFEVQIDGTPEQSEKAIDAMSVRYDAAIAHILKLEGENHAMQGKLDAHTDDGKVSVSLLTQLVQERTDACGAAQYLGLKNFGTLETDAIKKLVVMKAFPKIDHAEITPEYIQGRYDAVIDRIKQEHKNLETLTNLTDVVTDPERFGAGLREDELSPRDKLLRDTSDMWDKQGRKQREQERQRA